MCLWRLRRHDVYKSPRHVYAGQCHNDRIVLVEATCAIHTMYHTVLTSTPGAAVFCRVVLSDIPFVADWNKIGQCRQEQVEYTNNHRNDCRLPHGYIIGHKILIRNDGILRKAEIRYEGPYMITQVYCNGTVRIKRGSISEQINIRRLTPCIEES